MTALIGVLALQGGFREHREALERLGARVIEVRKPSDLANVEALILPGGESTAISKLLDSSGLFDAIADRYKAGTLPTFGTCAGMILSAAKVTDGTAQQRSFEIFQATCRRNAVGRQIASFEADLEVKGMNEPFTAIFIRPPVVEETKGGVEILAEYAGSPVLCAQGTHLFSTFHPELAGDDRLHKLFLERL